MGEETFTCAGCRGTFVKERSDAEALADMATRPWFDPGVSAENLDTLCDDCFTAFEKWFETHGRVG